MRNGFSIQQPTLTAALIHGLSAVAAIAVCPLPGNRQPSRAVSAANMVAASTAVIEAGLFILLTLRAIEARHGGRVRLNEGKESVGEKRDRFHGGFCCLADSTAGNAFSARRLRELLAN